MITGHSFHLEFRRQVTPNCIRISREVGGGLCPYEFDLAWIISGPIRGQGGIGALPSPLHGWRKRYIDRRFVGYPRRTCTAMGRLNDERKSLGHRQFHSGSCASRCQTRQEEGTLSERQIPNVGVGV